MAAGYDISASIAATANSATGATRFGNVGSTGGGVTIGGSSGVSIQAVLLIAGVGLAVWYFFFRKEGK